MRTPSIFVTAGSLSGGNQQKLIVGREMSHTPKVLIAAHPTRGVDVGAQSSIWDLMRQARREGLAVLLISADLEELIGLSDTIRVILRGRLSGEFDPDQVTSEDLGAAMTGAGRRPRPAPAGDSATGTTGEEPATRHTTTADQERAMKAFSLRRLVLSLAGPVLALLVAFVVTSLVLVAVGDPVGDVWSTLLSKPLPRQMVNIVNAATVFYLRPSPWPSASG